MLCAYTMNAFPLVAYIAAKGYLDLTAADKMLRAGMGFWVNISRESGCKSSKWTDKWPVSPIYTYGCADPVTRGLRGRRRCRCRRYRGGNNG
jgi:hypothetical protein